jgi:hypothetical protein
MLTLIIAIFLVTFGGWQANRNAEFAKLSHNFIQFFIDKLTALFREFKKIVD